MASPRIEYAVLPAGEGPGQDRCFTADGLVVVLDGASAYDPSVSPDASEYVDTLGPLLIEQITGTPDINLRDALAEAIRETAEKLQLIPGKGPSSTVSIVRWGDEVVDVLVLGDSPVVVEFPDGSQETIVQHPMAHIAPELRRRYRERLSAGTGYDSEHRKILAEIQRREAPQRNRTDGYWIAEALPQASYYARVCEYPKHNLLGVMACTDGALAALDGGRPRVDGRELSGADLRLWLERSATSGALARVGVELTSIAAQFSSAYGVALVRDQESPSTALQASAAYAVGKITAPRQAKPQKIFTKLSRHGRKVGDEMPRLRREYPRDEAGLASSEEGRDAFERMGWAIRDKPSMSVTHSGGIYSMDVYFSKMLGTGGHEGSEKNRNAPCSCASGIKWKKCCQGVPAEFAGDEDRDEE